MTCSLCGTTTDVVEVTVRTEDMVHVIPTCRPCYKAKTGNEYGA